MSARPTWTDAEDRLLLHAESHEETDTACPVCGGTMVDSSMWTCTVCEVGWMHGECYWGRIASLDEWRAFLRLLEADAAAAHESEIICAACRQPGSDAAAYQRRMSSLLAGRT